MQEIKSQLKDKVQPEPNPLADTIIAAGKEKLAKKPEDKQTQLTSMPSRPVCNAVLSLIVQEAMCPISAPCMLHDLCCQICCTYVFVDALLGACSTLCALKCFHFDALCIPEPVSAKSHIAGSLVNTSLCLYNTKTHLYKQPCHRLANYMS